MDNSEMTHGSEWESRSLRRLNKDSMRARSVRRTVFLTVDQVVDQRMRTTWIGTVQGISRGTGQERVLAAEAKKAGIASDDTPIIIIIIIYPR